MTTMAGAETSSSVHYARMENATDRTPFHNSVINAVDLTVLRSKIIARHTCAKAFLDDPERDALRKPKVSHQVIRYGVRHRTLNVN